MTSSEERRRCRRKHDYLRDGQAEIPDKTLRSYRQSTGMHFTADACLDGTMSNETELPSRSPSDNSNAEPSQSDSDCVDDGQSLHFGRYEEGEDISAEQEADDRGQIVAELGNEEQSISVEGAPNVETQTEDHLPGPGNPGSESFSSLGLQEPLFEESDITSGHALFLLASMYKKFKFSKSMLSALIDYTNTLLPKPHKFPKSKYHFLKLIDKLCPGTSEPLITYHCTECLENQVTSYESMCPTCDSKSIGVNVQNDLGAIVTNMFESQNLAKYVDEFDVARQKRLDADEFVLTDISDGSVYMNITKGKYDLCLIMNTDGFPAFNSSTGQVWPVLLTIIDIPLRLRKKFMILSNMWFSYQKPEMGPFLRPFTETLDRLSKEGVSWTHPVTQEVCNSKLFMICSVVDAQARAPLQNIMLYSGYYGCSFCEIPGEVFPPSTTVHYPYSNDKFKLRSKSNMLDNAATLKRRLEDDNVIPTKQSKLNEKGVRGVSDLHDTKHFDCGCGFSTEYLHSGCLGVSKTHALKINDSTNKDENYYVGKFEKVISGRLKQIKAPSYFSRLPRDLTNVKYWKGYEFMVWTVYLCLPCLENILPDKYLSHLALFVFSLHTLLKSELKPTEILEAEKALKLFCSQYGTKGYYGKDSQTFNLHTLLHYSRSVCQFGPLFSHSAFIFESKNGTLKDSIHGTGNIAKELANSAKIFDSVSKLQSACEVGFCSRQKITFLGKEKLHELIDKTVLDFVSGLSIVPDVTKLKFFSRLKINYILYTTESYSRATRSCSHYFCFKEDSRSSLKAAKALYYIQVSDTVSIFVGRRIILQEPRYVFKDVTVEHIRKFEEVHQDFVFGSVEKIVSPLVHIDIQDGSTKCAVLCIPPNTEELDL